IHVPHQRETARSHFSKLGSRAYLVISIAMVAIVIDLDSAGRIGEIRIAVGACSPVALRLPELESKLNGRLIGDAAAAVSVADLAALSPIDDVRGTADYRKRAAAELIRRGLSSFACEVSA
ncbi:MAG: xanthine dehydrogenase family protein subunit M, partial [Hyphomicrobiaceae bacterium]